MKKKEFVKNIQEKFEVNTKKFSVYDFEIKGKSKLYYVKVLNISKNHQITINSKIIWGIKKGKIKGIRFNTISSELLNIKEFNKLENKIILLTNKPYKILKVLNESDLKDVSEEEIVHDIFITSDIDNLLKYIK